MDIYDRIVVHARGGDRKQYQPIDRTSMICKSSNPLDVVDATKAREVYIADLNILQATGAHDINFDKIKEVSEKAKTMLDPGISSVKDVSEALELAGSVILGTETASLNTIKEAVSRFPGLVNVSIDKKDGKVWTKDPEMPQDPLEIIDILNGLDIKDVIILDMDRVGTSSGVDEDFLGRVAERSIHDVLLGGGVKNMDDIETLKSIGIKGTLVATALHNGSIPITLLQ